MEDIAHVFTEEDYRSLTNYKAFSQSMRYGAPGPRGPGQWDRRGGV